MTLLGQLTHNAHARLHGLKIFDVDVRQFF